MTSAGNQLIDFTLVYNQYKTPVYNYVKKMVGDQLTTEDLVQNVFLKLYQNISGIRTTTSIRFWIYTTCRNEVYAYFRQKKSKKDSHNVVDTDELIISIGDDTTETVLQNEAADQLHTALQLLPEDQRELFLLREYSDLTYREISQVMSIDEDLVKSRLFKTRQKLIGYLSRVFRKEIV